jgi:hypothetical protein
MHLDADGRIDLMVGLAQDGNLTLRGGGDGTFERDAATPTARRRRRSSSTPAPAPLRRPNG